MKKNRILIYASLLAFLGACTSAEQIDGDFLDGDFNDIPSESVINVSTSACENGLSAAFGYNAFIQNGVTIESGDTEGAIAMGGDLTVNGSFTVATQSAGAFFHNDEDLAASLVVNGQVIYASSEGINLNQGYLKIGDLTGSSVWDLDNNNVASNTRVTPGDYNETPRILLQRNQILESVDAPNIIDFDAAFTELNAASISLSYLSNNIILENGNKITLADTLNVLNVTGEELNSLTDFTFNNQPTANSPLIVNVDAEGEFVWNVQNQAGIGDEHGDFIVYNFFNSTEITIQRTTVIGSVLAPSSDVIKKSSDNINGQVIARSYIHMNGELHQHPYVYCPQVIEEPVVPVIEEPVVPVVEEPVVPVVEEPVVPVVEEPVVPVIEEPVVPVIEEPVVPVIEEPVVPVVEEPVVPVVDVCTLTVDLIVRGDGESITIIADSEGENLTYEWSNGSTENFIFVFPFETTTYSVIVTDQNGCTATASTTVIR